MENHRMETVTSEHQSDAFSEEVITNSDWEALEPPTKRGKNSEKLASNKIDIINQLRTLLE